MPRYFAQIDKNNVVTQVIVADPEHIRTLVGNWVETDMDGVVSKNYASMGMTYMPEHGGFALPKPEGKNSWSLDTATLKWKAPFARPNFADKESEWDEANQRWVLTDRIQKPRVTDAVK